MEFKIFEGLYKYLENYIYPRGKNIGGILMDIYSNIQSINLKIENACSRVKRNPGDVKLIAVSKTVDIDRMKRAWDCGVRSFGENKAQEIVNKYPYMLEDVEWHMIGHLQTNKVKYIVDKVTCIHSLDSVKLAEEINRRSKDCGRVTDVLIQVNIGREDSKYGVDPDEVADFINSICKLSNINICGLMAIAPAVENSENARPYFKRMKSIFDLINESFIPNVKLKYLSMGMTGDFEIAIEEGANIVRVGSGIFGPRNY